MKAVVVYSKDDIRVESILMPELKEYECRVKMQACGLCNGTDLKILEGKLDFHNVKFPTVLGHEHVGEIVEVGKKVKNYKLGDRYINPQTRIPEEAGITKSFGGMMEYGLIQDFQVMYEMGVSDSPKGPAHVCYIPDGISSIDAGTILTFKENYSGILNLGFKEGMNVVVYGDGPVGMGITKFLRLKNANQIVSIGHYDDRLLNIQRVSQVDLTINSKKQSVIDILHDKKFDLVIDAVGNTSILREGTKLLKQDGLYGVYGVIKKGLDQINLYDIPNSIRIQMITLPYKEHEYHNEIINMIEKGILNPKDFYSHVKPIEEINEAIDMVKNRQTFKTIITI